MIFQMLLASVSAQWSNIDRTFVYEHVIRELIMSVLQMVRHLLLSV